MALKHKRFTILKDSFTINDDDSYYLDFLDGNDSLTVNGSGTGHTFLMGSGDDSVLLNAPAISSSATRANVYLGQGNDTITIFGGKNNVFGGSGNDTISVRGAGNALPGNTIDAGDGDDILNFEAGVGNLAHGGAGNDTFNISGTNGTYFGDSGNDIFHLTGFVKDREIRGGQGNDAYYLDDHFANASQVYEEASEGFDTIFVRTDEDRAITLPDNVEQLIAVYSDAFAVNEDLNLIGNNGANHIVAAGFGSHINGKGGDDVLVGTNYVDKIQGGEGVDKIFGWDGDDVIYGDYDSQNPGVGSGDVVKGGLGNDKIYGGVGDDDLQGEAGNDYIEGGVGNDTLLGGSGNDHLIGENGNDILNGDGGADTMEGGSGNDTYSVDNAGDQVIEGNTVGVDTIYTTGISYTLSEYVENLVLDRTYSNLNGTGNFSNNTISGNMGNNVLVGLDGNDLLKGFDGSDFLYGDNGNDKLEGGRGNDQLFGGNHSDVLDGGTGKDVLFGGLGGDILTGGDDRDVFMFTFVSDSFGNGSNADTITDFSHGVDLLNLTSIDADTMQAGNQAFHYNGGIKPLFSEAGDLWTQKFDGGVNLYGDVDGNGTADFHVTFNNISELNVSDFLL